MAQARSEADLETAGPARRQEGMGGLVKGLRILESFTATRTRLSITEAARATGVTPAAARRCLLTLAELGYLTHDGKYFRPTPRMVRLGAAFSDVSPLPAMAQPCLALVRDALDESSSLATLDGEEVTFVARAEAAHIVSAGVRLGAHLPAHASASGRVLLAALAPEELDRRLRDVSPVRTTQHTLVDVASIRARIDAARAEDVSYTDEELELGVRTMAVPVRDSRGAVHAAMTVSASASRISMTVMRDGFLPVLRRQAARLGSML